MTKRRKIIVILISIISFWSCNPSLDQRYIKDYKKVKEYFVDSLIDHFPNEPHIDNSSFYATFPSKNSKNGVFFRLLMQEDFINPNILENLKLADQISFNDSCVLIIPWHSFSSIDTAANRHNLNLKARCDEYKGPIPNFGNINKELEGDGIKLPDDFTVFLLDRQKTIFPDSAYLSKGLNLPDNWQHGYTKGLAISEERKLILYWIEIW